VSQKKSQKVTRGSHRNDVSPLIQGLRYRAACDRKLLILLLTPPLAGNDLELLDETLQKLEGWVYRMVKIS